MEKCKYQLNRTIENSPYDNDVRYIDVEIRIYFDEEPLIINRDNYLVSFDMLEELTNDTELVAVITAAISAYTGMSNNKFIITSIEESKTPIWGMADRVNIK